MALSRLRVDTSPLHMFPQRPRIAGKFLVAGDRKLYLRGVTYGTFTPDSEDDQFPVQEVIKRDFSLMAVNNINAIRVYTAPPRRLLDLAHQHGLWVMVGLPWEQHIAFLDDPGRADEIEERIRDGVRQCAGHPAVLCYAIGNEIPATICRWYGAQRMEHWLKRLYHAAKEEDPEGLVTYVNFPSTEYLELPFLDFVCFNVYLESQDTLEPYLARLQNLAGDRPLVMAEIGLDSRRNGEEVQAEALGWQVRSAFAAGAAGIFVFAWTDEWYRGGHAIEDWDFGLCDRARRPKPALGEVRAAFAQVPFPGDIPFPRISVVVCSRNGATTIRDTCEGLRILDYPDFEVIVVDDGSTDETAEITRSYGYRVISTENRGLSAARNTGLEAATGEIVAYLDGDAYPDPQWLSYLAGVFLKTDHVGVGGPNIAPPGDGWIAECVANAPGGPVHVLLTDQIAEHIPGCNMAFRRHALLEVGGFDTRFRAAGDDVDLCWRLQSRGWTIGYSPAAMVWHHCRNSLRDYWRQQRGYGKAEALLEEKWPERYNTLGHIAWSGRLYGNGLTLPLQFRKSHIYHGTWGTAPFQSVYQPAPGVLRSLPLMPEWYFVIGLLAGVYALGAFWHRLLWSFPLLALALIVPVVQASISAAGADFIPRPRSRYRRTGLLVVTTLLHLLQPLARLNGRIRQGLTPWRRRLTLVPALPWPHNSTIWSETWRSLDAWPRAIEQSLRNAGAVVLLGGDFQRWDLEVRIGHLGSARLLIAVEDHGSGKQLVRFRVWPRSSQVARFLLVILAVLSVGALADHFLQGAAVLAATTLVVAGRIILDAGGAMQTIQQSVRHQELPFQ